MSTVTPARPSTGQLQALVGLLPHRRLPADDRPPGLLRRGTDLARRHRLAVVVAVHVVAMAAAVAVSRMLLVDESLRLDESQSLQQTDRSYASMLETVSRDVHVPGYHVLLRTWRLALGMDLTTARTLSLVFFLASVPVLYLVARRVLPTRWSLLAVGLYSVSPFMSWYADEARMYSMLVLVTLASQYFFLRLLRERDALAWGGYAAVGVVGAYTHYFFLFVLAAQGVFFVLGELPRLRQRWPDLLRYGGVAALVGASLVPWLLYFRANGSASSTRPHLPEPSSVDFTNVYSQFLAGFQGDAANSLFVATWPVLVLLAFLAVRVAGRPQRETGYLFAAAFGPVVLAFVVSHTLSPMFLSRYMVAALPALLLLVVVFISRLGRRVGAVVAVAALVATATITVVQARDPHLTVKEDYRGAAQLLAVKAQPQDLVVLSAPFTVMPFEQYYDGDAAVVTLPGWDRAGNGGLDPFDEATLPEQVDALAVGHQRVYLLLSYDQGYEDEVAAYFYAHYPRVYSQELTPGMRIVGYRVGYDALMPVDGLQYTQPLEEEGSVAIG